MFKQPPETKPEITGNYIETLYDNLLKALQGMTAQKPEMIILPETGN